MPPRRKAQMKRGESGKAGRGAGAAALREGGPQRRASRRVVTEPMPVLDRLLESEDPTVRYKARTLILGEGENSPEVRKLRDSIARSPRAKALLSGRGPDGRIPDNGPYRKWQGPHWTLYQLALIDYPPGDESLHPLRDQIYDWLLDPAHLEFPRSLLVPGQEERFRHCASIEGNAIGYSIRLGIDDKRTKELASRLARWRWPDGGWNCDKDPGAAASSVVETLIPLRGLALAARSWSACAAAKASTEAAKGAGEYFLRRRLFRRIRDGAPIVPSWGGRFDEIHFPIAFYDVLLALVVMAEIGKARDPRCAEALDLLESKRLADGGFPVETRTARTVDTVVSRGTWADWGRMGAARSNELVSALALYALKESGRLSCDPIGVKTLLARPVRRG
jgi:hypothetical protein